MPEPPQWKQTYHTVIEMRRRLLAPVDVAGCHVFDKPLHVLIALILSSRTKDQAVSRAMSRLKEIDSIADASEEDIEKAIEGVNFIKSKVKYVKATAMMIRDEYKGVVPMEQKELLKLPGVGPKTASLFLTTLSPHTSTGVPQESIAVDTHLQRVFTRWGWTRETTPTKIARDIESWLPHQLWRDINQVVVGFGQLICGYTPRCDLCLLNKTCPSSTSKTVVDIEDVVTRMKTTRSTLTEEFGMPKQMQWSSLDGVVTTEW